MIHLPCSPGAFTCQMMHARFGHGSQRGFRAGKKSGQKQQDKNTENGKRNIEGHVPDFRARPVRSRNASQDSASSAATSESFTSRLMNALPIPFTNMKVIRPPSAFLSCFIRARIASAEGRSLG